MWQRLMNSSRPGQAGNSSSVTPVNTPEVPPSRHRAELEARGVSCSDVWWSCCSARCSRACSCLRRRGRRPLCWITRQPASLLIRIACTQAKCRLAFSNRCCSAGLFSSVGLEIRSRWGSTCRIRQGSLRGTRWRRSPACNSRMGSACSGAGNAWRVLAHPQLLARTPLRSR